MNTIIISTGFSRMAKRWKREALTWDELKEKLRYPLRTEESCAEYRRMTKDEKDTAKDHGGFVGGALKGVTRKSGECYERHLITLDADKASLSDWDNVVAIYNWTMCAYSTHSHRPDAPRLRYIIPVNRAVTRDEYEAVARKCAEAINIDSMDVTTYQQERLMFWPSCSKDAEYLFKENEGQVLDVDAVLADYGPDEAWRNTSLWPIGADEVEVVKRAQKTQADPTQKRGIVGLFCRTYSIDDVIREFLPEVYTEAGGDRYTYAAGSTSAGAVVYGDGKWLYSNHSTDPAGGLLCNAFDLVRIHKFGNLDGDKVQAVDDDSTKLKSYRAMVDWVRTIPDIRRELMLERRESRADDIKAMDDMLGDENGTEDTKTGDVPEENGTEDTKTEEQCGEQSGKLDDEPGRTDGAEKARSKPKKPIRPTDPYEDDTGGCDPNWESKITIDRSGGVEPTIGNVTLILENDPDIRGAFGVNEFNGQVCLKKDLPWRKRNKRENFDLWEDSDDANLRAWFEQEHQLMGKDKIYDGFTIVAKRNKYHPIRRYLQSLEWDGTERLDDLLIRYFGARDTELTRAVTRKWFVAGVARIMVPGTKFDNMLMLIGPQGIGKSTFMQTVSLGFYNDSIQNITGKDAYDALRGVWMVEMAELAGLKKSESEAIKAYFSKREDSFRPAYMRNTTTFKRQCVFYGSSNTIEVLKDKTGGRRFWPVIVEGKERGRLSGLKKEVDQVWAEAVRRYEDGESLWLDNEKLYKEAEELQEYCTVDDEWTGIVQEFLDTDLPDGWENMSLYDRRNYLEGNVESIPASILGSGKYRRDIVSVIEIRREVLNKEAPINACNDTTSRRITDIMATFKDWRKCSSKARVKPYGPQRIYVRRGSVEDTERR